MAARETKHTRSGLIFQQWPNMALKGTCRFVAVLQICNLSSYGASFTVRERHAP